MKKIYFLIKDMISYCLFISIYTLKHPFYKKLNTHNVDETITKIIEDKVSVSRFGDGEYKWILGQPQNSFQKDDPLLAKRLLEVLQSDINSHIVCICYDNLKSQRKKSKLFWKKFFGRNWSRLLKLIPDDHEYYDTHVTRFYLNEVESLGREGIEKRFNRLKQIWNERNLLIVEGRFSRLGIGNDLFDNAKSIRRILAPEKNAFDVYDNLFDSILEHISKDDLVLIALGPTATILAYDLAKKGIQAIDLGHLDIEYEWFLRGVKEKCRVENKYVNEAGGITDAVFHNTIYESQIICRIQSYQ
jgi:glycosyltransferase family protein